MCKATLLRLQAIAAVRETDGECHWARRRTQRDGTRARGRLEDMAAEPLTIERFHVLVVHVETSGRLVGVVECEE